jgi:hypothetical protein
MIFTYENGKKTFFTQKQYRHYRAVLSNFYAQWARETKASDALLRARAARKRAYDALNKEHAAAFRRGQRFRRKVARS